MMSPLHTNLYALMTEYNAVVGSTVNFSTNLNWETLVYQSQFPGRSYKIGQVVGSYVKLSMNANLMLIIKNLFYFLT